jgi:murein L,D-transpeptidase YafK
MRCVRITKKPFDLRDYALMRWLFALLCLSLSVLANANPQPPQASPAPRVDKILVVKSERKLQLISHGKPFKSYRISLGKVPTGHKEREGDQRTPEGIYWVDWRKTSDNFNLSMHISYPNARDMATARNKGTKPGGMIMIHGTPLDAEYPEWFFNTLDWTNGCIAMTNPDMREVWSLVKDGTLIEIRP